MSEAAMLDLLSVEPSVPGYPCAFSEDRRYRYALWRHWGQTPEPRYLMAIGLNPSTADETQDDPTIRRCIRFARDWGFDALCMTNLFAFRATDPDVMKAEREPEGLYADYWLHLLAADAGMVLAAWGVHGGQRAIEVTAAFAALGIPLHALGFTKAGDPRHPLYMPAAALPIPYPAPAPPEKGRSAPTNGDPR